MLMHMCVQIVSMETDWQTDIHACVPYYKMSMNAYACVCLCVYVCFYVNKIHSWVISGFHSSILSFSQPCSHFYWQFVYLCFSLIFCLSVSLSVYPGVVHFVVILLFCVLSLLCFLLIIISFFFVFVFLKACWPYTVVFVHLSNCCQVPR